LELPTELVAVIEAAILETVEQAVLSPQQDTQEITLVTVVLAPTVLSLSVI
jgi:hypothetical protein